MSTRKPPPAAKKHASTSKPAPAQRPAKPESAAQSDETGMERLVFFSDAVFAIAITLLALEIRLPAGREITTQQELFEALISIAPKYLAYVLSFLVIGVYWMSHHRMFRMIVDYDRSLIFLNLLLLMLIGFVPFPTSIIGENLGPVATIFYALTMTLVGLVSMLIWWYASGGNGRLLARPITRRQLWISRLRLLIVPIIFLVSIGIALWDDNLARLSWVTLLVLVPLTPAQMVKVEE
jgi:uncharacterized membrane protein